MVFNDNIMGKLSTFELIKLKVLDNKSMTFRNA